MRAAITKRLLLMVAFMMSIAGAAQAYTGAIYTTWPDGTVVNGNVYDSKDHVYLNGGPQNDNSAGLPDGVYYFQVTDPSGKVLLSSDPAADRKLMVYGGRVYGVGSIYSGTGDGSVAPGATDYLGTTIPVGTHSEGAYNADNQSVTVQLMPYDDTPNPGGEYKAWLIPVDLATVDEDGVHLLFSNSDAKTDNFKIRNGGGTNQPSTIVFLKFYDANANGLMDPEDVPIPGFQLLVSYTDTDGNVHVDEPMYTDATGAVSVSVMESTPYAVKEVLPTTAGANWYESYPNANSGVGTTFDPLTGLYGYAGTTPAVNGELDRVFGNYAASTPSGGLTMGFWSNQNGQAILRSSDNFAAALARLRGYNLRNNSTKTTNGNDYDPVVYLTSGGNLGYRNWLLGAFATNMAYMLSAQMSAMGNNIAYGYMDPATVVYIPDSDTTGAGANIGDTLDLNGTVGLHPAVGGWTITIGDLFTAANTELGQHGLVVSSGQIRTYQDALKTLIDQLNNNGNIGGGTLFVLPPIPTFSYP